MKKLLCGLIALLMLTGCTQGNVTDDNITETQSVTVSITVDTAASEKNEETTASEAVTTAAETTTETTSETTVKVTETEAFAAAESDGFVYKRPDKAYLSELINSSDGEMIYIAMYADGRIENVGKERIEAIEERANYELIKQEMLNEEYFEQLSAEEKELFGISTYEEYEAFFREMFMAEDAEAEDFDLAVYFFFDGRADCSNRELSETVSEEEKAAYALRAVDYFFSIPLENDDIIKKMAENLNNGNNYFCHIGAQYCGNNVLNCMYEFGGIYAREDDGECFSAAEKISADGSEGFILGGSFIPENTEMLAISSRTEMMTAMLAGDFIPEGCTIATSVDNDYGYEEEAVFDIAEIKEKLPKLKELYMYQAVLENADKLAEMDNLEVLSYYRIKPTAETNDFIESINDTPFIGMDKLKEIRLYGEYADYDFLGEMKGLENAAVRIDGADRKKLDSVFKCEFITELEIDGIEYGVKIDGIEKLKNLKILDIDGDNGFDAKSIGKLSKLEKLEIMSDGRVLNLSEITKLKNLKSLMLHSMDEEDLSFIGEMTSLEQLDLYYVNSSFEGSIGKLKNLKSLSLNEISEGCNTDFLENLDKLEHLHVFSNYVDLKGASKAENLKSVSVWLCNFHDLSELKKCKKLESLMIYNCTSPFDAEWIDGLKLENLDFNGAEILNYECLKKLDTLKNMTLYFCTLSYEQVEELEKALPQCSIDVEN